jgi:hypothetical protein
MIFATADLVIGLSAQSPCPIAMSSRAMGHSAWTGVRVAVHSKRQIMTWGVFEAAMASLLCAISPILAQSTHLFVDARSRTAKVAAELSGEDRRDALRLAATVCV